MFEVIKIDKFLANVLILYPRKTPEKLWFSFVFMGHSARDNQIN